MNNKKLIREMSQDIACSCVDLVETSCGGKPCYVCIAEKLVKDGYRKTDKEEKTCTYQQYFDLEWDYWECSNCGEPFCFNNECTPEENQYHYCPNCGARITEYKGLHEDE